LLDSSVSAVLLVCRASAEFIRKLALEVPDVLVDDFDVLEDELADEFEELEELPVPAELDVVDAVGEALVGWKKLLPGANPTFAAFVPPTEIMAVSFWPVMTSLPLESSHAVVCALP
jgi:hypothetical protein